MFCKQILWRNQSQVVATCVSQVLQMVLFLCNLTLLILGGSLVTSFFSPWAKIWPGCARDWAFVSALRCCALLLFALSFAGMHCLFFFVFLWESKWKMPVWVTFLSGLVFVILWDTCTWLVVAHRHARTSSHSAERLNLRLSGKGLFHKSMFPVTCACSMCFSALPSAFACAFAPAFALHSCRTVSKTFTNASQ